jgi:P27 family predicted phage terminase small subunit
MTAGRKPIPTEIKILNGNPGRRPLNTNEPKPDKALPKAPAMLSKDAKREWRKMSKRLYHLGLLTEIDVDALAILCQTWSNWCETERAIQKVGKVLVKPDGTLYKNPMVGMSVAYASQMKALIVEFGMTPSSRTKIKVEEINKEKTLAEMLFDGVDSE